MHSSRRIKSECDLLRCLLDRGERVVCPNFIYKTSPLTMGKIETVVSDYFSIRTTINTAF